MKRKNFYREGPLAVVFLALLLMAGPASAQTPTAADTDFDGNGVVDFADFLALVDQFGARQGDGRYDAKYDLDSDGAVGFGDFLSFTSYFGSFAIRDANLRAIIADSLDKASSAPISREEMASLTKLGATSKNISDLTELEFATGLTNLYLHSNSISDISALSGLTNLTVLGLSDNSISDLSPLIANTGLGSRDVVEVRNNPLSDTSLNTHIPALQGRGVRVLF